MNSCRSTLIVDVYDVVPWQSPGGTTFHDVNGAKLSWLAVCILAVVRAYGMYFFLLFAVTASVSAM